MRALLLTAVLLALCASSPAPAKNIGKSILDEEGTPGLSRSKIEPFAASEYRKFAGKGRGAINGEAFARTKGGSVIIFAGATIGLTPVTTHSSSWIQYDYLKAGGYFEMDHRTRPYTRKTMADSKGQFQFTGLPAGRYWLYGSLTWLAGLETQGGPVAMQVDVDATSQRAFLTP